MGLFKAMFETLEKEVTKAVSEHVDGGKKKKKKKKDGRDSGGPPTRWEKAVIGLDKIVSQVVKVDPDGVDVVCFGGNADPVWYRNIKNTKGLEEMVNTERPKGACLMGSAMDDCINDAFDKDITNRPVAILVLTAGKPDDADDLDTTLTNTVNKIANEMETCPLSITFFQVGDDDRATNYLSHLDNNIQAECAANGETFDLVDTIKDDEIQAAMSEIKGTKSSGTAGALIGAFAGAAMGVGGMYIYNKQQAKKRTEGWNGKWKLTLDGDEICQLDVVDDQQGNITINGLPCGEEATGTYTVQSEDADEYDSDDEYAISFIDPSGDWVVEGTVEDEHAIVWSDGTRWDEIPPDNGDWKGYAAAGIGGAAAAGATGYLLDKKFFNKAAKKDQCDYIILMDRSAKMAVIDY